MDITEMFEVGAIEQLQEKADFAREMLAEDSVREEEDDGEGRVKLRIIQY